MTTSYRFRVVIVWRQPFECSFAGHQLAQTISDAFVAMVLRAEFLDKLLAFYATRKS